MDKSLRTPPPTWMYVDWIGGREEFDRMFSEYPPELKAISERTIMCADIIDGVMQCFWDLPEEFPAWVKKHYSYLDYDWVKEHYPHLDLA